MTVFDPFRIMPTGPRIEHLFVLISHVLMPLIIMVAYGSFTMSPKDGNDWDGVYVSM